MYKCNKFTKITLAIIFILFCSSVLPVYSQDIGVRVSFKEVAKSKPKTVRRSSGRTKTRRTSSSSRVQRTVVVKTKEVVRNVKTSNLTVSSEPGAEVSIFYLKGNEEPLTKKISSINPDDTTIEFENLTPGEYKVLVSLEGFESQDTTITVPSQKTVGIDMDLEPITYDLIIETNIKEGEIRYAPAEYLGKNPDGSLKTKESGGYCIVPIENGEAQISELKRGYYNIDVRPKEVEYQSVLTAINVPTEILENNDDNSQSYSIELEKKISTETFSSSWIKNDWNLPDGWTLQNRAMQNMNFQGVALPKSEQYRYYTNFELISDVVSLDGKSIGFAVRAFDVKNYYLIQISGKNSPEPFVASGFVVKDGVANPLFSIPIEHFSKTIEQEKNFRVIIKGEKNVFKIFIENSETADRHEVGNMIDRDENFKKGAVGIVGRSNSKFSVGSFTICANVCK